MSEFDAQGDNTQKNKQETRFMVGSASAKYLHGKSTKPIMSFTLEGAKDAATYLSKLDYGKFVIFELVPVVVEVDGTLSRQT